MINIQNEGTTRTYSSVNGRTPHVSNIDWKAVSDGRNIDLLVDIEKTGSEPMQLQTRLDWSDLAKVLKHPEPEGFPMIRRRKPTPYPILEIEDDDEEAPQLMEMPRELLFEPAGITHISSPLPTQKRRKTANKRKAVNNKRKKSVKRNKNMSKKNKSIISSLFTQ